MDRDTKEVQASACICEQKFRHIQLYEFISLTFLGARHEQLLEEPACTAQNVDHADEK